MVTPRLSRRALLTGLAASALWPHRLWAEEVFDLNWTDLLPENTTAIPNVLQGFLDHDTAPIADQPASTGVRPDWNGKIVRLPGFIVPIEYRGTGVTAFLLVPYVGACVHVPPPPANQLVFVTTSEPYETDGAFEAVNVTGMFGVSSMSTQLAEVGYALSADKIEPFELN